MNESLAGGFRGWICATGEALAMVNWVYAATMKTAYFTFGQCHVHSVNGKTFDKDCVVKITAEDPREVMFDTFGPKWAMQYDNPPRMELFPRGIFEL